MHKRILNLISRNQLQLTNVKFFYKYAVTYMEYGSGVADNTLILAMY